MDYIELRHLGDGKFEALMDDWTTKPVGPTLCGMIRYTYFEDYTLPPLDWTVTKQRLYIDYKTKVLPDLISGKIKPGKHNF
jgi:hypothetical protein